MVQSPVGVGAVSLASIALSVGAEALGPVHWASSPHALTTSTVAPSASAAQYAGGEVEVDPGDQRMVGRSD
jgi:hypothetical protein